MRWQPPSKRVQIILLSPILVIALPVLFVALAPLPAMEWLRVRWLRRQAAKPIRQWFAWRPVKFSGFWDDVPDQWLWLETVEARWKRSEWEYRPLGFVSRFDDPGDTA